MEEFTQMIIKRTTQAFADLEKPSQNCCGPDHATSVRFRFAPETLKHKSSTQIIPRDLLSKISHVKTIIRDILSNINHIKFAPKRDLPSNIDQTHKSLLREILSSNMQSNTQITLLKEIVSPT